MANDAKQPTTTSDDWNQRYAGGDLPWDTGLIDRELQRVVESGEDARDALARIIEVIEMQKNWDWVKKYYTDEQLADLASRWSPELQAEAERDWAELIRDVKDAVGEDPAGERAQALAARWSALIERFTGGDSGIRENLGRLYADRTNWPQGAEKPYPDDVGAFIAKRKPRWER